MNTALALLYHDPNGQLAPAIDHALPLLHEVFSGIAICASPVANPDMLRHWQAAGALVDQEQASEVPAYLRLGQARRRAVTLALQHDASHVLYCDGDRVLHWAATYPGELRQMAAAINAHDFMVLGRTPRAFATHPRVQRDTEGIVNMIFAHTTGLSWDVGSGSRGLSRRAIEAINAHCPDDTIAVDQTWPLCLRKLTDYTLDYGEVEGLEFETGDGYDHQQANTGDYTRWLEALDDDPQRWAFRVRLAQLHVEKMIEYR